MKSKFPPAVYEALKARGFSNRGIADLLGVSEAAVRRGLKSAPQWDGVVEKTVRKFIVTVEEA